MPPPFAGEIAAGCVRDLLGIRINAVDVRVARLHEHVHEVARPATDDENPGGAFFRKVRHVVRAVVREE